MNSNLCDHDTSTSRADGRTDRRLTSPDYRAVKN